MLDLFILLILSKKATNLHANRVLMYKHLEIGSIRYLNISLQQCSLTSHNERFFYFLSQTYFVARLIVRYPKFRQNTHDSIS